MEQYLTCVKAIDKFDNEYFKHFGITNVGLSIYGNYKPEDIITVKCTLHEDQSIPSFDEQKNSKKHDYWAWVDSSKEKISLVWNQRFLLNMCFPYGIKSAEDAGQGKAYRINVEEHKAVTKMDKGSPTQIYGKGI